jgi:hypothetical protein
VGRGGWAGRINPLDKGERPSILADMENAKAGWRTHLTEAEIARLLELEASRRADVRERRRIYDRCRKRAIRKQEKANARDL